MVNTDITCLNIQWLSLYFFLNLAQPPGDIIPYSTASVPGNFFEQRCKNTKPRNPWLTAYPQPIANDYDPSPSASGFDHSFFMCLKKMK